MSDDWRPWRDLPTIGTWGPEDAGESGIECPACGRDTGYIHRCAHCGRLAPDEHDDAGLDLADPRSKPHRNLRVALQKPDSTAALRQWLRGIRSGERLQQWLDAADDLAAAMRRSAWRLLVRAWTQQRADELDLDEPADLRTLVGAEKARADTRPALLRYLADEISRLEEPDQNDVDADRDARAEAEALAGGAIATDGGQETEGKR